MAEALVPLIYAPLYASVYAATMHVLPGAFFLLGAAMTVPAVFIFLYVYKKNIWFLHLTKFFFYLNSRWMYKLHKDDEKNLKAGDKLEGAKSGNDLSKLNESNILSMTYESKKGLSNGVERKDNLSKITDEMVTEALGKNHYDNDAFSDEEQVQNGGFKKQSINLVKEIPALNLEHCKL